MYKIRRVTVSIPGLQSFPQSAGPAILQNPLPAYLLISLSLCLFVSHLIYITDPPFCHLHALAPVFPAYLAIHTIDSSLGSPFFSR